MVITILGVKVSVLYTLVMAAESSQQDFEPFTLITQEGKRGLGIVGHLKASKEWIQGKHAGVRPWGEFVNVKNVARPRGASDAMRKVFYNVQHFQSNYLFIFLGLVIYCIVTNPTLLFALGFCGASWWFISVKNKGEDVKLLGRETSSKELYALVGLISIPLFYIAGAGSTVFWIIGASVVVILVHALIMDIPDQTADEELGIVMEDVTIS